MDLWERDLRAAANLLLASYLSLGRGGRARRARRPALLHEPARGDPRQGRSGELRSSRRRRARAPSARWRAAISSSPRRSCAPRPPRLVAIGGLSGTGKSALAAALAPEVGRAPGALMLRSDVERKRLFAVAETERLPPAGYDLAATEATYARLIDKARRALAAGQGVILDAVYAKARRAPGRGAARRRARRFPSSVFGSRRRWRRASSGSAGAAATPPTPTLRSPRASRPKSSPSPAGAASRRAAGWRRPSQRRGES